MLGLFGEIPMHVRNQLAGRCVPLPLRGAEFVSRAAIRFAASAAETIVISAPSIIADASPGTSTRNWVPTVTAATGTPI